MRRWRREKHKTIGLYKICTIYHLAVVENKITTWNYWKAKFSGIADNVNVETNYAVVSPAFMLYTAVGCSSCHSHYLTIKFCHTYTVNRLTGWPPPPKIFKTVWNYHMPLGAQLVHDPLINLHSNNHHLISQCCHGNKYNNPRRPPMAAILDFRVLKFCLILRDFVGNN